MDEVGIYYAKENKSDKEKYRVTSLNVWNLTNLNSETD